MTRGEIEQINQYKHEIELWEHKAQTEQDADILQAIELLHTNAMKDYQRLYKAIESLQDKELKAIINYRYIQGMTWQGVASRLGYGTADSIRVHCARMLDK